jgi:deazaflavin-dependent oxidoreductase (nitroreductase family)
METIAKMNQTTQDNPRWHHRAIHRFTSKPVVAWLGARAMHHIDRAIFRLSGGRITGAALLSGLPTVMLTTIGAKSGLPRTTPLIGVPIGHDMILIGSNWGQTRHPAWVYNLRANPRATVTVNRRTGAYLAREATGVDREVHWQRAVALYPGYAAYSQRTGGREIPVMILTPESANDQEKTEGVKQ